MLKLVGKTQPFVFELGRFGAREPLYINIIRDPLARMVSAYYFKRFGDGKSNQNFKGTEEEKNRVRNVSKRIL